MTDTVFCASRIEAEYREQSNNPRMAGVTMPSWRCKLCKKSKPLTGRKSLGYKQGFCCADCAKERM